MSISFGPEFSEPPENDDLIVVILVLAAIALFAYGVHLHP